MNLLLFNQSCPTFCDSMDCITPGFSILLYLPVCSNSCPWSQWCHPTVSSSVTPSPPALNLYQHQGLMQLSLCIRWPKYWSFSFSSHLSNEYSGLVSFRIEWFPLGLTGLVSSLTKAISRVFSSATLWKHKLFCPQPFLRSNYHICI